MKSFSVIKKQSQYPESMKYAKKSGSTDAVMPIRRKQRSRAIQSA
jgi:hypothetical protein